MRTYRRQIVAIVTVATVATLCGPATALAVPADNQTTAPATKIGDTPADFAQPTAPAPKAGDTPADFPGASGAPAYESPATIEVVRPERTVVRDADAPLPVILAGVALLVALGAAGLGLVQRRSTHRVAGRST